MREFRVWQFDQVDFVDVKGESYETVARRFWGQSKKMMFHLDSGVKNKVIVTIDGSVQGTILMFDQDR